MDVDLSGLDPGLREALYQLTEMQWQRRCIEAQKRQNALAKHILETKAVDGMGELTRRVDAWAFHDWAHKLGSYDCWHDKGFNRYYDRIAPETRVKSRGTRIQSGYRATPEERPTILLVEGGTKRFTKTYA